MDREPRALVCRCAAQACRCPARHCRHDEPQQGRQGRAAVNDIGGFAPMRVHAAHSLSRQGKRGVQEPKWGSELRVSQQTVRHIVVHTYTSRMTWHRRRPDATLCSQHRDGSRPHAAERKNAALATWRRQALSPTSQSITGLSSAAYFIIGSRSRLGGAMNALTVLCLLIGTPIFGLAVSELQIRLERWDHQRHAED